MPEQGHHPGRIVRGHGRDPAYEMPPPRPGGWTSDDLDRLPGLPPHTELIDGTLVVRSAQTFRHMAAVGRLERALVAQAPPDLSVVREMTILLGPRDRPEPDLAVVPGTAWTGNDQTSYPGTAVLLAVEVTLPDSEQRDREVKPLLYARAGIAHYWRVETGPDTLTVHVHELDTGTGRYRRTDVQRGGLAVCRPFRVSADLASGRYL
ncbi:Uma2 family endonuclease [Streptomyces tsukubensis]|uniref:Uma2 family endonuclease n=1 Tax=Streptomyces tsukubensis TaxID=83656 RepID=UPI00345028F9